MEQVQVNQTRLVKNLTKNVEQEKAAQENLINETQKLLGDGLDKDRELLRKVGLDFALKAHEKTQGEFLEKMKLSKEHLGLPTVDLKEVVRLCKTYNLVITQAEYYMGPPPPTEMMDVLRKLDAQCTFDRSDMYIICTPDVVNNVYPQSTATAKEEAEKRAEERRLRLEELRRDPILLYKVPKTNVFVVLQSWGEDLSAARSFFNSLLHEVAHYWILASTLTVLLCGYIAAKLTPFESFTEEIKKEETVLHAGIGLLWNILIIAGTIGLSVFLVKRLTGYLFGTFEISKVRKKAADWKAVKGSAFHSINMPKAFYW